MGALLALLGSLLWGTADFLGGSLSKRHKAIEVVGSSQLMGLAIGVTLVLTTGAWKSPSLSMHGYFLPGVLAGVWGLIGLVCFYMGLATGRMGVVSPISSLSAIIPMVIAFIGGEAPHQLQIFGMVLALLGIFFVSGPEVRGGLPIKPLILGVITAISFGLCLTFMAQGSKTSSLLTMTSMRLTSTTIILILAISYRNRGSFTRREFPTLLFIGAADFMANVVTGLAVTRGMVSVAMVLSSIFPLVTVIWSFIVFHERLQKVQYLGALLALAGVAAISVGGA